MAISKGEASSLQSLLPYACALLALVLINARSKHNKRSAKQVATSHANQVFCHLKDGLGNQLFQIANAIAFSRATGRQLVIGSGPTCTRPAYWDSWFHRLVQFKTDVKLPRDPSEWIHFEQPHFHYEPIPHQSNYLTGYFQSIKYFESLRDELSDLFALPPTLTDSIRAKHGPLLTQDSIDRSLIVHIRRSDYLKFPGLHGILTPAYFESAVAFAKAQLPSVSRCVVFSDDLDWCKRQTFLSGSVFVDEPYDAAALWLMSQFKHYVMSNSSFSWWAVTLNEPAALVVAPDMWFGPKGPQDYEDVYQSNWVKFPVRPYL